MQLIKWFINLFGGGDSWERNLQSLQSFDTYSHVSLKAYDPLRMCAGCDEYVRYGECYRRFGNEFVHSRPSCYQKWVDKS